jgi:hypothetical protein
MYPHVYLIKIIHKECKKVQGYLSPQEAYVKPKTGGKLYILKNIDQIKRDWFKVFRIEPLKYQK